MSWNARAVGTPREVEASVTAQLQAAIQDVPSPAVAIEELVRSVLASVVPDQDGTSSAIRAIVETSGHLDSQRVGSFTLRLEVFRQERGSELI